MFLYKKIFFLANNQRHPWPNSTGKDTDDDVRSDESDTDFGEMLAQISRRNHTDDKKETFK